MFIIRSMRLFINILLAISSLILLLVVYMKVINELSVTAFVLMVLSYICFLMFYIVTLKGIKK